MNFNLNNRLCIHACGNTLAFSVADHTAIGQTAYEPFLTKSGISLAANLREAFRTSDLLNRGYQRAELIVDTPALPIPLQEFDESLAATLYHHTIGGYEGYDIHHQVLHHLNAVVLYALHRDLRLVVEDHFTDVRYTHLMQPVWDRMLSRSYTGPHRKLFAHFHGKDIDIFSFDKNRFRFSNTFETTRPADTVYFILSVWKQLALDNETDELHLSYATRKAPTAEDARQREQVSHNLRRFLKKVYTDNATTDKQ